jgi:hypothetical protein
MLEKGLFVLVLLGVHSLQAQVNATRLDFLTGFFKSKAVKRWGKERLIEAIESEKIIVNPSWHRPFSVMIIPTLRFPKDSSILNWETQFNLDDIRMPIHIWGFNFLGLYSGFYNNDYGRSLRDTFQLDTVIHFHLANNGGKRYENVTWAECANALHDLNADFIFRIDGIYHTYFYYKRKKLYIFGEHALKSYSVQEYYKKNSTKNWKKHSFK